MAFASAWFTAIFLFALIIYYKIEQCYLSKALPAFSRFFIIGALWDLHLRRLRTGRNLSVFFLLLSRIRR